MSEEITKQEQPCTINSVISCFNTEIDKEDVAKLIGYLEVCFTINVNIQDQDHFDKLTEGIDELLDKYRK